MRAITKICLLTCTIAITSAIQGCNSWFSSSKKQANPYSYNDIEPLRYHQTERTYNYNYNSSHHQTHQQNYNESSVNEEDSSHFSNSIYPSQNRGNDSQWSDPNTLTNDDVQNTESYGTFNSGVDTGNSISSSTPNVKNPSKIKQWQRVQLKPETHKKEDTKKDLDGLALPAE